MKHIPIVSIIVPVYNMGKFLERSIDSFLSQSEKRIEIIICNNNSTDNTELIVNSYKDDRIIFINHETNIGMINNFNSGLGIARGKYITLVSCDEFCIGEDSLSRRLELLESNREIDLVWCGYDFEKDDGNIVSFELKWPKKNILTAPEAIDAVFMDKQATNFRITTVLFRREILSIINYRMPLVHSGDLPIVLTWLLHSRNAAYISDVLHRSYMHSDHKHDFFERVGSYLGERDFLLIRFIDEWRPRLIAMNLPIIKYELTLLMRMTRLLPRMSLTESSNFSNYSYFTFTRYIALGFRTVSLLILYPSYILLGVLQRTYLRVRGKLSQSRVLRKIFKKQ